MTLEEYSRQAEELLRSLIAEFYRHGAGLKDRLEIAELYERHAQLFAPEVVRERLASRESREGRYLADFAATGLIEHELRAITEHIGTAEAQATVAWDDEEVPWRQAMVLLANEPEFARRHDLERRIVSTTAQLNDQRRARLVRSHQLAEELGFPGYVELCDELGGLQLARLAEQMRELLARTEGVHRAALEARLTAAGIPRAQATTGDWNFLRRAQQFDGLFPKEDLLPALRRTLIGLGISMERQENLHVDVEERPLKSPRAFCAPVRIPEEVWLVMRPHGGHDDYNAILHEAGHAEHFTHAHPDLPFAYRHLGDNSVTEAYAFLFGNLQRNPVWLREVMRAKDVQEYLALNHFSEVFMLRRYAAKLQYELELHRAPALEAMPARYAETLGEALAVRVWPENYLFDVDDAFYVACYLRAWVFEVQLRAALIRDFGEAWFTKPAAGERLIELWRLGQQYTADELAQKLGYGGLDPEPLIADLTRPV